MKLVKEIVKKGEKKYTNYVLEFDLNGKTKRVPIEPKTFGKTWDSPEIRSAYVILNIFSELIYKD